MNSSTLGVTSQKTVSNLSFLKERRGTIRAKTHYSPDIQGGSRKSHLLREHSRVLPGTENKEFWPYRSAWGSWEEKEAQFLFRDLV